MDFVIEMFTCSLWIKIQHMEISYLSLYLQKRGRPLGSCNRRRGPKKAVVVLNIKQKPKPVGIPPATFYNHDVAREHVIWKEKIKTAKEKELRKMDMLMNDYGTIIKSAHYQSIELVCNSFGGASVWIISILAVNFHI